MQRELTSVANVHQRMKKPKGSDILGHGVTKDKCAHLVPGDLCTLGDILTETYL